MVARKYNDVPKKIKLQHCCFSETVYIMNKKNNNNKKMYIKICTAEKGLGYVLYFSFRFAAYLSVFFVNFVIKNNKNYSSLLGGEFLINFIIFLYSIFKIKSSKDFIPPDIAIKLF